MAGRLQDKVAIVTGAGSRGAGVGNGKAVSLLFAREGAKVCLVDNVLSRAEETLADLEKEGGVAFAIDGDVSKGADCQRIVAACVQRFGRVDILHNNVGIDPGIVSVVDVDEAIWDQVMLIPPSVVHISVWPSPHRLLQVAGRELPAIFFLIFVSSAIAVVWRASKQTLG